MTALRLGSMATDVWCWRVSREEKNHSDPRSALGRCRKRRRSGQRLVKHARPRLDAAATYFPARLSGQGGWGLSVSSLLGTAALITGSEDARANTEWAEWFQGNYRLMTDDEKAEARARLERRYSQEYGKKVSVDGTPAMPGVLFGYGLNVKKCIGCRRCVKACVEENNQSRGEGKEIEWIRVLKMERGEFTQEKLKEGYPDPNGIQVGGNAYSPAGIGLEGSITTTPRMSRNLAPHTCHCLYAV